MGMLEKLKMPSDLANICAEMGAAGKRLVREGRGAAERTTALVKKLVAG